MAMKRAGNSGGGGSGPRYEIGQFILIPWGSAGYTQIAEIVRIEKDNVIGVRKWRDNSKQWTKYIFPLKADHFYALAAPNDPRLKRAKATPFNPKAKR